MPADASAKRNMHMRCAMQHDHAKDPMLTMHPSIRRFPSPSAR